MQTEPIIVELSGIRVTHDAIQELDDDGRPLVVISRADVAAVRLRHGYVSERPFVLLVVGLLLTGAGLFIGASFVRHLLHPEAISRGAAQVLASFAMTLGIGPWAIVRALRKGMVVEVALRSDRRRLAFRGRITPDAAAAFLQTMRDSAAWSAHLA